jgi:hypothetical protein
MRTDTSADRGDTGIAEPMTRLIAALLGSTGLVAAALMGFGDTLAGAHAPATC